MPLDAITLTHLTRELDARLAGSRVDKIYMPDKNEAVLLLRAREGNVRLLLCASQNGARLQLTTSQRENPKVPPMLCMLLRKHLVGARLLSITQEPLERVVRVQFEVVSELGDLEPRQLVLEMMGRTSNMILLGPQETVLAALHYIDMSEGKNRQLIPGVRYRLPERPDKLDVCEGLEVLEQVAMSREPTPCDRHLLDSLLGLSPLLAREMAFLSCGTVDLPMSALDEEARARLVRSLSALFTGEGSVPTLLMDAQGTPVDFSCMPIAQYGTLYSCEPCQNYSVMLDRYYALRDAAARKKQKTQQLDRVLKNATERISKKLSHQRAELTEFRDRDKYRIYGELLTAGLSQVPKGAAFVDLPNYYEEGTPLLRIPLDVSKSPALNAQGYFKKYQQAKNGEQVLKGQIEKGEQELAYLESVQLSLEQAESEAEISSVREELTQGGYLARPRGEKPNKSGQRAPEKPMRFLSADGFPILVGKNNTQNDMLVTKIGEKQDIWLHVLGCAGSHVLVQSGGKPVPDTTLEQAAQLAALFSKASPKEKVPVTYTALKNVKKPSGAKPGYVVYFSSQTAYVTPPEDLLHTLSEQGSEKEDGARDGGKR